MSRKSILWGTSVLLVLASIGGGLMLLASHEPSFYRRAVIEPASRRQQLSHDFQNEFYNRFINSIINYREWRGEFTQEQINSYLAEDFVQPGIGPKMPDGIRDIRVAIDQDRMRIGFRYGGDTWNSVISVDLSLWLVTKEPNVVALEIQGLHAGALPMVSKSLLERIAETARRHDMEVTWYRHHGRPVALVRFQADQKRPTVQLRRVELQPGKIMICGRSLEGFAPRKASAHAPLSHLGIP
ncbi:MAG: hypothetical protein ACK4RK_01960 [Gemmataceae bacterium]